MSFYSDGQPAMAAFRHPEAVFALNPYAHHEQQSSLAQAPSACPPVYPFIDSSAQTQLCHRQSYGDVMPANMGTIDNGVWQPPQAPRLTAAAARAGRQQMTGFAPNGYAQAHGAMPWYAQASLPQPYQQPRTHQQLEHQLLIQHHLAKAHERQNGASMHQPGFGPAGFSSGAQQQHPQSLSLDQYLQQQQHHHHHHHQAYPGLLGNAQQHVPAHHDHFERQPRYQDNWSNGAYHRSERPADAARDWSGWHSQAFSAHRASMSYLPQHDQLYPNHQHLQAAERHPDGAALHESAAWTQNNHARAPHPHAWDQAAHYPQHSYAEANHCQAGYLGLDAAYRSRHEYIDQCSHVHKQQDRARELVEHHRDEHNHMHASHHDPWHQSHSDIQRDHAVKAQDYDGPDDWQQEEVVHEAQNVALASVADEQKRPAGGDSDQSQPAPSSPDSLEKSALPIATIGAQLIWNACTALFDPELLIEAHETSDEATEEDCDEAMSPAADSMPSSSSTPSLNTPDISPWASTVLDRPANDSASSDWNAFRSPFGPDRLPPLRPQALSFTFGSDQPSSHHDLHRMAVGAERARSALAREFSSAKRFRQGSGLSEATTAHSSGASTASSSEPGTPASLAHESPALSSTISAHSVETARSPPHAGLGMSLDRSRSDTAIRARRSSSKTSPKLSSSKWSGRIRDNVLAVLRLVSPDWRWSNNDRMFVSLSESLAPASAAASAKGINCQAQGRSGRDSVASIATSYANEPSPAFRRFVHQVLAQTLLSPSAFLLGILNALRLLIMAQMPDGTIDPAVLELFAQPTSAAPFKLFTLGMMIANKHLDDNTFLNRTWNEVTGIPLAELNQTEAWFLKKCNYEVTVPDETWIGFLNRLQSWEEKRSSRGMHRDHDSSKRLLLVLDEALGHFDAIPAFQLDGEVARGVRHAKAASPVDMWAKSHHRTGSLTLLDDHQHCRSAPAVAMPTVHKQYAHDDELYASRRPSHVSRASLSMENPSATLLRSSSDYAPSVGPFDRISPLSESGKSQNGTMSGPLLPSALLNGSRALFQHGSMFGPLATSGWAHH
ncbi:uncharacterized protein MEPE_04951 [Melanopsichium pennsylvanicum]|uniref:Cyclin N-terminal domain-containing protein n=2 Tax=Melanopsichium pennsylvanicum TaxID=63383 RepID=A0AAJ4XPX4_9BASI|nr:putative protein [Melanopsichium pennsylvanicum 4]SNX86242.1 uncharacterized protein MEPE_04951 [Melanopsichium pennsylvanicum]